MPEKVEVNEFARAFVGDEPPAMPGADIRKNGRGYYIRLDFDGIDTDDLTTLVSKARETYDQVEVVEQFVEGGEIAKERRYVDSVHEVPEGYEPQEGPMGGIFYETEGREPASEEVDYEGQPVLAVHFEDIEPGDRIAFEKPESGERDMGEVIDTDPEENLVTVSSGDGETDVFAAPLEGLEKGEGSLTSGTAGAHNAVHSEDDEEDDEEDLGIGGEVAKNDGAWVSFVGPKGGQGWVNMQTGEKRYQKERPGDGPEDFEEEPMPEGWTQPPESADALLEGQTVEFQDHAGEFHEGEYAGVNEQGYPTVETEDGGLKTVGEDVNNEITAVEELDGYHPLTDDTVLDADMAQQAPPERLQGLDPGDGVYVETEEVDSIDEPAREFEVMGFDEETGELHVYPTEEMIEQKPGVEGMAVTVSDDEVLTGHEYDEIMSGRQRLEELGLDIGEEVIMYDEDFGEYHEGEVIEPMDGHIAVEADNGAVYFPDKNNAVDLVEEGGYEYSPDDFNWDPEWEMGDVEYGDAAWIDNKPYLVSSTPHSNDQAITVSTEEGNTFVDIEDVDALATSTPPEEVGWAADEPPDIEDDTAAIDQLLSGTQFEEGDPVGYYGQVGEITGVTSLTDDDEPSHIVADFEGSEDEITLHPNTMNPVGGDTPTEYEHGDEVLIDTPDGKKPGEVQYAEDEGRVWVEFGEDGHLDPIDPDSMEPAGGSDEPAEDAVGQAVEDEEGEADEEPLDPVLFTDDEDDGYDIENYSPDDVEEWRDMSDIGANHGNSVAAMEVAVLPDGSKAVHKDVSHHSVDQGDVEREMAGYEAMKHFYDNVPAHASGPGWVASGVAPGVDAIDATPEMKDAVGKKDFRQMAAAVLLSGNTDAHQNNVRVDEDGNLYPFDLDRCGGNIQSDWVGKLDQYEDSLDRALGELEKTASALGVQMDRDGVLAFTKEYASQIDEETIEAIKQDADEHNPNFAQNIVRNIKAFANGEIQQ